MASVVLLLSGVAGVAAAEIRFSGEKRLNNLVSELLEVSSISKSGDSFTFTRSSDGWIFINSTCKGPGTLRVTLDKGSGGDTVSVHDAEGGLRREAMSYVTRGEHSIDVECKGDIRVETLVVKAIWF